MMTAYFDPPDKTQSVLTPLPKSLHPALPPLPPRIARLPVDARGYPVPWFVEWFHADGSVFGSISDPIQPGDYPDFRVVSTRKMGLAVRNRLCWVCGGPLGRWLAFVIGPMCAVNRTSGEPPSHRDCAMFAATACPFLTKPGVARRENNLPEAAHKNPAHLDRNPGVAMVWITGTYEIHRQGGGDVVFRIGNPEEVFFFCEGRTATRAEIMHSIETGLPFLRDCAAQQGTEALTALDEMYSEALALVPAA